MKKYLFFLLLFSSSISFPQKINLIINEQETKRIETVLSSDDMQGRKVFTSGIEKAAEFIESEFKKTGLKPFPLCNGYRQEFDLTVAQNVATKIIIDGIEQPDSLVVVSSFQKRVHFTEKDAVEIVKITASENFRDLIVPYLKSSKNLLVLVDPVFNSFAKRLKKFSNKEFEPGNNSVVIVFGVENASAFTIDLVNNVQSKKLFNVVGILPGKTKPTEYVIFSAHYDHLGIDLPVNGDSIYNGANDDAAGTTAVILLAEYFETINNNERTLIFITFTAEESGGYGSQYFSKQLNPDNVMAMFNIEMIGTESKWGNNSAYITGYGYTNMGEILQKNLTDSAFQFYPDPYIEENLFYRSDNAALARKGVPAHTISTSKMDNEPNYHKPTDEIETLNLGNMTEIIKAIAVSSKTIVSGKDTPSRVDTTQLTP